jgi:hypothetical protein
VREKSTVAAGLSYQIARRRRFVLWDADGLHRAAGLAAIMHRTRVVDPANLIFAQGWLDELDS